MKTAFNVFAVATFLALTPNPCFALWFTETITKERAKDLGMEVRSTPSGPNQVQVELEFNAKGELQNFSHVDLRLGKGDNPAVTAPLREDRSKPGRAVVRFAADRTQLAELRLWVMVPELDGGTVYDLPVRDFVEPTKDR